MVGEVVNGILTPTVVHASLTSIADWKPVPLPTVLHVFNPLNFERRVIAKVHVESQAAAFSSCLIDAETKKEVPSQVRDVNNGKSELSFWVNLKAYELASFYLDKTCPHATKPNHVALAANGERNY